jgi:hypothetical protein
MVKKFAHSQFPILENILWQQKKGCEEQMGVQGEIMQI